MMKTWTWTDALKRESSLVPPARDAMKSATHIEESGAGINVEGEGREPLLTYTLPGGERFTEILGPGFALSVVQLDEAGEPIPSSIISLPGVEFLLRALAAA